MKIQQRDMQESIKKLETENEAIKKKCNEQAEDLDRLTRSMNLMEAYQGEVTNTMQRLATTEEGSRKSRKPH